MARIAYESGNQPYGPMNAARRFEESSGLKKTETHIAIGDARWNKELHKFLETN
jgi:hypothetical protein